MPADGYRRAELWAGVVSKNSDLLKLARELDDEHCADFPVKWVADEIRRIVEATK